MVDHASTVDMDDVMLVMTEVVTNAARHGGPPVLVELVDRSPVLLLRVSDGSDVMPRQVRRGVGARGGRGVNVVGAVAHRWGASPGSPTGKTVWCEFQTNVGDGQPN